MAGFWKKMIEAFGLESSTKNEEVGKTISSDNSKSYNQEIYDLLMKIDEGYSVSEDEKKILGAVEFLEWRDITKLPNNMGMLKSLRRLFLKNNELSDISALSNLKSLSILDLRNTSVIDITALLNLTSLSVLSLAGTKVIDISALSYLTSLSELSLAGTKVIDISALTTLTFLSVLDLSDSELIDISSLSKLTSLSYLDLSNTRISNISALSKLTSLSYLNLSNTDISNISALSGLKNLSTLDLSEAEIDDLKAISELTSLICLNLQNSKTTVIPESILDLKLNFVTREAKSFPMYAEEGIYIHGLVLVDQPIEIFSQSRDLIRAYYSGGVQVPVNECKVIFLGDAESGKTHSIRRLLENGKYLDDFDGKSTPGIETTVRKIKTEDSEITINYWDFGGQEIQHSMHRVFLTERTVYVVFLNARQDDFIDERAKYWMENIKAFAPEAPVLVVINKIDQNEQPRFNKKGILEAYGNQIKKVIRLSAKEDMPQDFLYKLEGSINNIVMEMPTVHKKVPRSWKNLMESIRTMPEYYLTTDEFIKKCESNKIMDYEVIHDDLVDLFQVIGISFCYYQNRSIADYMLLNPQWMHNALYTIVTNGNAVAQNGVISQNDLYDLLQKDTVNGVKIRRVIPDLHYKGFEINYILGVIRMFGLSYCMRDGSEFFPMLCDGDEKISVKEVVPKDALHVIFRYAYLPTNVMHRLVVEMQSDLDYRYVWYTGAIFRNTQQNHTAYIHSVGNDLHIYVYGDDEYYNLNEYLTPISNTVRDINQGFGISAAELLAYRSDSGEAQIPLKRVIGNLRNGLNKEYNETLDEIIYYDALARRYFDSRPKADDILNSVVRALQTMQNDKTYFRTEENSKGLENSRNRFVSAQLGAAGYLCSNQLPGGIGLGKKAPGERDFVVRDKNGVDLLIYEALNLKNFDSSYLNKHIQKLLDYYNPMGLHQSVLVTYLECGRDKFKEFTDKYREHISEYAPQPFRCLGKPEDIRFEGEFLACMKMKYEVGGLFFMIYHIVVRVAP